MDQSIQEFVKCKRLAVLGMSRNGKKFGNTIYNELKQRGYQVFAVHPEAQSIGDALCVKSLSDLKDQVDGVVMCLPPKDGAPVLRDAAANGVKRVWLQMGADSPELVSQGRQLGLDVVAGKCILMYAEPVQSFHKFHRFFARLFGQL